MGMPWIGSRRVRRDDVETQSPPAPARSEVAPSGAVKVAATKLLAGSMRTMVPGYPAVSTKTDPSPAVTAELSAISRGCSGIVAVTTPVGRSIRLMAFDEQWATQSAPYPLSIGAQIAFG